MNTGYRKAPIGTRFIERPGHPLDLSQVVWLDRNASLPEWAQQNYRAEQIRGHIKEWLRHRDNTLRKGVEKGLLRVIGYKFPGPKVKVRSKSAYHTKVICRNRNAPMIHTLTADMLDEQGRLLSLDDMKERSQKIERQSKLRNLALTNEAEARKHGWMPDTIEARDNAGGMTV